MAEVAPKQPKEKEFRPYIAPEASLAEFTPKAILLGAVFGILFGAATVYLALKAGLTVSASIPIAVIAISLGRKLFKTTILENNIIQTTGSAGESIAAGVVFTLPGFLFLSMDPGTRSSVGAGYFSYVTLFVLSLVGGILGVLMMIPLRRSLIVKEHGALQYPEGTACASVLIAGDKGGDFAKAAFQGVGVAFVYALLQKVFHVVAEAPAWVTRQTNKWLPSATVNGEITPEYLGVGYIIGPRIAGVLVAGGVLAWLGLIPLLSVLVPPEKVAAQLAKLGYLKDVATAAGGWDPATRTFADLPGALYRAYVRQIGAGAVAAGGFITLLYCALDTATNTMQWTSAGHPMPLLQNLCTGEIVPLAGYDKGGMPLGVRNQLAGTHAVVRWHASQDSAVAIAIGSEKLWSAFCAAIERPEDELFFIVGADSFNDISTWHQYQAIFALCNIVSVQRPGSTIASLTQALPVAISGEFCYDSAAKRLNHSSGHCVYALDGVLLDTAAADAGRRGGRPSRTRPGRALRGRRVLRPGKPVRPWCRDPRNRRQPPRRPETP